MFTTTQNSCFEPVGQHSQMTANYTTRTSQPLKQDLMHVANDDSACDMEVAKILDGEDIDVSAFLDPTLEKGQLVWMDDLMACADDIIHLLKEENIHPPSQVVSGEQLSHTTYYQPGVASSAHKTSDFDRRESLSSYTSESSSHSSGDEMECAAPLFHKYQNDRWMSHFSRLVEYKELNGNCDVPYQYNANQQLAQWVKRQRRQYRLYSTGQRSSLTSERVNMLNSLGFTWNTRDIAWEVNFMKLKRFHAEHRHCKVPADYLNGSVANWLKKQRRQYRRMVATGRSTLTEDRIHRMESLGFVWGKVTADATGSLKQ